MCRLGYVVVMCRLGYGGSSVQSGLGSSVQLGYGGSIG